MDLEEAALLEVGGDDAPAAFEVAVEAVAEHVAEGALGLQLGGEADLGIGCVERLGQVDGAHDLVAQLVVRKPVRPSGGHRPIDGRAQQADLDEVVEVAGLERGVLAVIGKAQELARAVGDSLHVLETEDGGEAEDGGRGAAAFRAELAELGVVRGLPKAVRDAAGGAEAEGCR